MTDDEKVTAKLHSFDTHTLAQMYCYSVSLTVWNKNKAFDKVEKIIQIHEMEQTIRDFCIEELDQYDFGTILEYYAALGDVSCWA